MIKSATDDGRPSAAIRAEAATWLAHLRGPSRSAEIERGFQLWLNAKPEHLLAFELASDAWDRSAGLRRRPQGRGISAGGRWAAWQRDRRQGYARAMAWAAAVMVVALIAAFFVYPRHESVVTRVGEQRAMTLSDGTRINLNTDTRVIVEYSERERLVRLEQGEASFEVARNPERPFVVNAAAARIEVLGTSFVVRRDQRMLSVTLVDGQVKVVQEDHIEVPARLLQPGERLTLAEKHAPRVDRPAIDKVTAWQHGQVAFDDIPLAEAVVEMNRYSDRKLAVEGAEAGKIRVGGLFRSGDVASFAQAVAAEDHLRVVARPDSIILSK